MKALCKGSIVFESACLECDRCIDEAKKAVIKYGKTPMNKIKKQDLPLVNISMTLLQKKVSRAELTRLIRGGK